MSNEEMFERLEYMALMMEIGRTVELINASPRYAKAIRLALKTHQDAQPNEPLTEEEIKKMVGEPVYYPQGPEGKRWLIVDYITVTAVIGGAKLYRRPPKDTQDS